MKKEKICFVISPIGEKDSPTRKRSDDVYNYLIDKVIKTPGISNYKLIRADKISKSGVISRQIMKYLFEADLVIADLTNFNPNVFYELALRHAIKKPFIQIVHISNQKLPFDLQDMRTIVFNDQDPANFNDEAPKELYEQIKEIEINPNDVETPIPDNIEFQIPITVNTKQSFFGSEIETFERLFSHINNIFDSESAWIKATDDTWNLVEFRNAFGMFHKSWIEPSESSYDNPHSDKPNEWPGHKRCQLSFERKKQIGINWPGVVYEVVTNEVCVASRPIQEFAVIMMHIARCLDDEIISAASVRYLWRSLDLAIPLEKDLHLEPGHTTEYPRGGFWRWIEFFVFGNTAREGLASRALPEKLEPWKKLAAALSVKDNPHKIDHK